MRNSFYFNLSFTPGYNKIANFVETKSELNSIFGPLTKLFFVCDTESFLAW